MADHRAAKGGPGFRGNFDGSGDEKLVVGHLENVERSNRVFARLRAPVPNVGSSLLFLDKGDVAAAFEAGQADGREIFGLGGQAQVFLEVVL